MPVKTSAKGSLLGTNRRSLGFLLAQFSSYSANHEWIERLSPDFIVLPHQQWHLAEGQKSKTKNLSFEAFILSKDPEDLHDGMISISKRIWLFGDCWDSSAWQYAIEIGRDFNKEIIPVVLTERELQVVAMTDTEWLALPAELLLQVESAYRDRSHVRLILISEDLPPKEAPLNFKLPIYGEIFLMDQPVNLTAGKIVEERNIDTNDH